jgi:hypothetical protein
MRTLFAALVLMFALTAHAEQMERFGDLEVHYNAMPTDELTPEVARAYQLERSRNRGLMTISVIKRDAQGVGHPVKARVSAVIKMLTTQTVDVALREVVEGEAIYYLGDFRVIPPTTLRFEVVVRPAASTRDNVLTFSRTFY